jgi:hypothetical protein
MALISPYTPGNPNNNIHNTTVIHVAITLKPMKPTKFWNFRPTKQHHPTGPKKKQLAVGQNPIPL